MIPTGLGQQIHVREQRNNVHGQRNRIGFLAIAIDVIGSVLQHDGRQSIGIVFVSFFQAVHVALRSEVAAEGAGPGEEDVRQGGRIRHGSLDLGLVGLIFESFPLDLHTKFFFDGSDSRFIRGAVRIAFSSDTPHGDDFLFFGEHGSQGQQHSNCQDQSNQFLHFQDLLSNMKFTSRDHCWSLFISYNLYIHFARGKMCIFYHFLTCLYRTTS